MFSSTSFANSSDETSREQSGSNEASQTSQSAKFFHKQILDETQKMSQWKMRAEMEMKNKSSKIEELMNQNDRLERELNEERQSIDGLKTQNRCLEKDIDLIKNEVRRAQKAVAMMKSFGKTVKTSLEKGEAAIKRVVDEDNLNNEDLKELTTETNKLKALHKELKFSYEKMCNEVKSLSLECEEQKRDFEKARKELKQENSELVKGISTARGRCEKLESVIAKNKSEVKRLRVSLSETAKESEKRLKRAAALFEENERCQSKEEMLVAEVRKLVEESKNGQWILKEGLDLSKLENEYRVRVFSTMKEAIETSVEQLESNVASYDAINRFLQNLEVVLRKNFNHYQKESTGLKELMADLLEKNSTEAIEFNEIQNQLLKLCKELESSRFGLAEENLVLKKENQQLEEELKSVKSEFEGAIEQFNVAKVQMDLMYDQAINDQKRSMAELIGAKEKITDVEQELVNVKALNDSLTLKNQSLTDENFELQNLTTETEQNLLQRFENMKVENREQVEKLQEEIAVHGDEIKRKADLLNDRENEVGQIRVKCEELQDTVKKLVDDNETIKFVYEESFAEKSILESEKEKLLSHKEELQAKLSAFESSFQEFQVQSRSLEVENVKLVSEKAAVEIELSKVNQSKADMENKLSELVSINSNMETYQVNLEAEKLNLSQEKASLEEKVANLEAIESVREHARNTLEAEKLELQKKFDKICVDKQKMENEHQSLLAKCDQLNIIWEQRNTEYEELHLKNDSLRSELDELRMKFAVSEGDVLGAQRIADEMQTKFLGEIDSLKKKIEEKDSLMEIQKQEADDSLEQLRSTGQKRIEQLNAEVREARNFLELEKKKLEEKSVASEQNLNKFEAERIEIENSFKLKFSEMSEIIKKLKLENEEIAAEVEKLRMQECPIFTMKSFIYCSY